VEVMLRDLGEPGICGAEGIVGESDFASKGSPNPSTNTSSEALGKEIALFFMSDDDAAKQGFVLGWDCPS
jgi:hypothetical protein